MKNKKGILTKNVLSLLVAVMGIILLIFVSVSIYNSFESQEEKNARAFLDGLMGKIDNLEDGETGVFPMTWVEDYRMIGYDKSLPREEVPEKCFFESCICICKDGGDSSEYIKDECQSSGFCKDIGNKNLDVFSKVIWNYEGNICEWKDSEEIPFRRYREYILHNLDNYGGVVEIEIFKNETFLKIIKSSSKNVLSYFSVTYSLGEYGSDTHTSQYGNLQKFSGAKTVELNDSTKECYFIKN